METARIGDRSFPPPALRLRQLTDQRAGLADVARALRQHEQRANNPYRDPRAKRAEQRARGQDRQRLADQPADPVRA